MMSLMYPRAFFMRSRTLRLGVGFAVMAFATLGLALEIDLRPRWDDQTALQNPHKGWYHHFPDNHIDLYKIRHDSDLIEFPGMDHLYMRLAWAYLEPNEGDFQWSVIDPIIEKWTNKGLGVAFRISCRETGTGRIEQQFATPRWVVEAGAKGGFWYKGRELGPEGPWEPDFDDPIYLEKLQNFLTAFGKRYDGRPWLRYVDIGSIGDWGEGHTWSGSRRTYGFEQRKKHVDLHRQCFVKTQLVATDDFVYGVADPEDRERLLQYMLRHGITCRDDSILVNGYVAEYGKTFTVRSPEFFAAVFHERPTILELQHYGAVKRDGNWTVTPDSSLARFDPGKSGPDYFLGAVELLRATYIGYHGYADEWLSDNPELTRQLLNRCGYWYFLHRVHLDDVLTRGTNETIRMQWENRGVAPAYKNYQLLIRLTGPDTHTVAVEAGNRRWIPDEAGTLHKETYGLKIPNSLASGAYVLKIKLRCVETNRDVRIALDERYMDQDGFCEISDVIIR